MLDELLGRAPLKARIDALEDEVESLTARLEAERERRAEATSDRQEADEAVNRLEDRIADLEGQLERARSGEPSIDFRGTETLRGGRLDAVLGRLEAFEAPDEGALTAMVDGAVPDAVGEVFGDHVALVRRAAPCLVCTDDAGLVSVGLEPVLPPGPFVAWGDGFELDRSWFEPTGTFALAVVRSDVFAYGEFDGAERTHYEGFESDVKADHSKGGFSQGRFGRRRDAQIEAHLEAAHEVIDGRDPERLIVAGERTLLGGFADRAVETAVTDATGAPETALEAASRDLWSARLYRI